MKTAIVTLSAEGCGSPRFSGEGLDGASIFVHEKVEGRGDGTPSQHHGADARSLPRNTKG